MSTAHNFTITDPRTFDGNPFEVAERAVAQLEGLMVLLRESAPLAELMARNAEMTRRMDSGQEPEGDRWATEPQGRQWAALDEETQRVLKRLRAMKAASGFDPKHPPKV